MTPQDDFNRRKKRMLIAGTSGGIGGAVRRAVLGRGWETVEVNRGGFDAPLGEEPFDGVVFASGMCRVKPLQLMSEEELTESFSVNCGLFVKLMRRIVRERLHAPTGMKAVAISSVSATEGWAGGVAYCASKGALSAACRALDAELAGRGISVVALEPRHVRTKMFDDCAGRMGVDPALAMDADEFAETVMELFK